MSFQLRFLQAGVELVVQDDHGNKDLIGLDTNRILGVEWGGHGNEMQQWHEDKKSVACVAEHAQLSSEAGQSLWKRDSEGKP
jgi:hypothetical protein